MFLDFKIGVKSIQTAGYNGARTSVGFLNSLLEVYLVANLWSFFYFSTK